LKNNVLLVSNPISGGIDKLSFIDAVVFFTAKKNQHLIQYETSGKEDISKIKALYKKYKPERIIIIGGDGTIKMVAEAIANQNLIIGILPAGSANGLAVDLDLMKTLEENLEIAFQDNYIELDIIAINGEKCIHLSDLGLNAELVKNYAKSDIRGKWGYMLQIINTLIESGEPFEATIKANNQTYKTQARMIVIANSKKYGTGVTINPNGELNDGMFELVILKNLDLIVFTKIISGNIPIGSENVQIISTNRATIRTNFPVCFQIDGEYCGIEDHLKIKIVPQKIKIAVPK
jgi:diacylglycerol kinase (ATP)